MTLGFPKLVVSSLFFNTVFKVHFNINLPSMHRSPKLSLPVSEIQTSSQHSVLKHIETKIIVI
jgi:hypothetical protein